jgi:hypothetical protein
MLFHLTTGGQSESKAPVWQGCYLACVDPAPGRRRNGGMTVLSAVFSCFLLMLVTGCGSEDITTVVAGQGMDAPLR